MSGPDYSNIHRHLDEAFAAIPMTMEIQDLKEEIRGNLSARLTELTGNGLDDRTAAAQAIDELGDIRALAEQINGSAQPGTPAADVAGAEAQQRYRVRPKPAYVVGIVVAAIAATLGLLLAVLGGVGMLPLPVGPIIGLAGLAASGTAWIVGDTLAHETTGNYPVPEKRAAGYFLATFLTVYGLAFGGLVALGALPVWAVVFAALGIVAGTVLFTFLGATQTNRKKPWARAAARQYQVQDRFAQDPVAAARFGIYTVVLWLLAFAAFVVLSMTVGFLWSWLALLAGLAGFMVLLARMLFPDGRAEVHK